MEKNPPQMSKKFLPRMIENETKEETEIGKLLSVEKFKSTMHLYTRPCSKKYEIRLNNVDATIITYFTANYENDICDNLIELWERDCKKEEEKSIRRFHGKEEWYLNNACSSGFCNAAEILRQEKKSQGSRNSKNDWKGRSRHNQQRKKKNSDSRYRSRGNNQHNSHEPSTNKPIKHDKEECPTLAETSAVERRKKRPFLVK